MNKIEKDLFYKDQLAERYHKENRFLRRKDRRLENEMNVLKSDHELLILKYGELVKEN